MTSLWDRFRSLLPALSDRKRLAPRPNASGLPQTLPHFPADDRLARTQAFDPALKHFGRAFRDGEPVFRDERLHEQWREMRHWMMDHLLGVIAASRWRDSLILRGSVCLRAWLGPAAREPRDLDWIVVPERIRSTDRWSDELLADLVRLASTAPPPALEICGEREAVDDIWTYDRVPGRRLAIPWQSVGLPPGTLQLDFVFGERMPEEPIEMQIPLVTGGCANVRAASPALALSWKLAWLHTDMYPQGKDLYDATLLAEQTHLPLSLLEEVFQVLAPNDGKPSATMPLNWKIQWDEFVGEYPAVVGTAEQWQERLSRALHRTFTLT